MQDSTKMEAVKSASHTDGAEDVTFETTALRRHPKPQITIRTFLNMFHLLELYNRGWM